MEVCGYQITYTGHVCQSITIISFWFANGIKYFSIIYIVSVYLFWLYKSTDLSSPFSRPGRPAT